MLKHIVVWKFADSANGKTKADHLSFVKDSLYALVDKIPQIKKMEIGIDISGTDMSGDMVLITEFENKDDLKIYAEHPEHVKVAQYVRQVTVSRTVVDFNF
ncbi:MAG: Dabb family protein [Ruminococcaceae bacterium]|nr:Dabb family protein [Oscillospiraceae bacterium]